jgi:HSP20 family protein
MPMLVTRTPFAELDQLRGHLENIYADWFDGEGHDWAPAIDVERGDKDLTVRANIPGFSTADVKIEAEDGMLTISGEHEESVEDKGKSYLRRERRSGSFRRTMALPAGVDPSKIKAQTKDGVLEVNIPLPEEPSKKSVTIKPTAA